MIYLVGTGAMAVEYVKVLQALKKQFIVIGRGESSAGNFFQKTQINPFIGGLAKYLSENSIDKSSEFIIATGTESLMETLKMILTFDIKSVLIEKPAAISIAELLENENYLQPFANKIYVAYNRRFYASVIEVQRLLDQDGGLQSMHFEFTEWAHKIETIEKPAGVKENWFFANSTHVVDLAFYLAGNPKDWNAYSSNGQIKWHTKSNYVGAGVTDNAVLFSYISNWESAGRWGIELLTSKRRIYLKPLEDISIQLKGSLEIQKHLFDSSVDINFKPGLFFQVSDFLSSRKHLISLTSHIENTKNIYAKINLV